MPDFLKATDNVPPSFLFDGRRIRAGDQFISYSTRMTNTLIELGLAELCQLEQPTFHVEQSLEQVEAPKRKARRKNQYGRRDMRAQD